MRIIHDNLIDDLSSGSIVASSADTNYPIANVQDQRLGKVWKSDSGSTAQSVTFTLNTFPEYPDDPAGTTYRNKPGWTTGVDGWVGNSSTLSIDAGTLKVVGSGQYNYIGMYRGSTSYNGKHCVVEFDYDPDMLSARYYTGSAEVVLPLVRKGNRYVASGVTSTSKTTAYFYFFFASAAIAATKTIRVYSVYIGTGLYDTAIPDLSDYDNDGIANGVVPIQGENGRALYFEGDNSYITLDSSKYTNTSDFTFCCTLDNMKVSLVNTTPAIICREGALANKAFRVSLGMKYTSTRNIVVSLSSDGVSLSHYYSKMEAISITNNTFISVVYNSSTLKVYYYVNGNYFDEDTVTKSVLYYTSTQSMFIGRIDTLTSTTSMLGSIEAPKLWNRALTAAEIKNEYEGVSYVTERDGLCLDLTLDKDVRINTAAILGHNLEGDTTVKIQANNINYWDSPSIDEILTVHNGNILKFFTENYVYKYWRFYFYGQGGIEIGRLWLGTYKTIDPSSLLDFRVFKKNSDTVVYGKHRQKFGMKGESWRRIELSFPNTSEDTVKAISDIYDEVGRWKSFIFCNFDTLRDYVLVEPMYGSFQDQMTFSHYRNQKYKYTMQIEEDL